MSAPFDEPRQLPAAVVNRWLVDGRWTTTTVSAAVRAPIGDADATACVVDDERYSFATLRMWSEHVAAVLGSAGVRRGDRVLIQLPSCVEQVVSILAAWHVGAIAVPTLPMLGEHEVGAIVRQTDPAAVIFAAERGDRRPSSEADAAFAAARRQPAIRLSVGATAVGWAPFPVLPADHTAPALPGFAGPGDCALVLFTSGTTAEPKGVRHDSRSLLAEAESFRRSAALTSADIVFNPAPIAHIGALVATVLVPWRVGAPVVLTSRWDPVRACELITREAVTFAVGAPVFLKELVELYESPAFRGHRVTKFQTGAAPTSSTLLERADVVGVTAWRAWGMTEAPTISYGGAGAALAGRVHTDGRVEPGSEVVAVDAGGRELAPGSEGELCLRSPKQMLGYIKPATGSEWADGWLRTGDLGTVDADGWVTITGRIKDIINRGGEKFSTREIEDAICAHPAIATAAVLGVPEERLGEQVVAFVTVRAGEDYPGYSSIIDQLVGRRIAVQKRPVSITVLDGLPLTPTGKVHKPVLAKRWAEAGEAG
jgi:acyl-CoA synthetase